MIIEVHVKSGTRSRQLEKLAEPNIYAASVTETAVVGQANRAVIELVAGYFDVPKSLVTIKHGQRSKIKLIEITS